MTQIVITSGDPAGCGPLIALGAVNELKKTKTDFFVVGDQKIFQKIPLYQKVKDSIHFINANTPGIEKVTRGCISKEGGTAGLNYLKKALELMRQYKLRRLVTAPLSKEAVQLVAKDFSGHSEFLAEYFGVKHIAMMMAADSFKVILFTRHVLLSKVPELIRKDELLNTFFLTYSSLQKIFKIKKPKIAVASLNPHAGINTFMAKEERIIFTAIKQFKKPLCGPYPSDTLFLEKNLKKYDCIICLYHDQAMIPFKLLAVKEGVNLTLGLPIIRTSPAHGVAYDVMLAGKTPFHSSMVAAIKLAMKLNTD